MALTGLNDESKMIICLQFQCCAIQFFGNGTSRGSIEFKLKERVLCSDYLQGFVILFAQNTCGAFTLVELLRLVSDKNQFAE